jgi:hypothetical protein
VDRDSQKLSPAEAAKALAARLPPP